MNAGAQEFNEMNFRIGVLSRLDRIIALLSEPINDGEMHAGRLAAFCEDCRTEITSHTDCPSGEGRVVVADEADR